jgi:cytochrome c biogenesis protein CcdA
MFVKVVEIVNRKRYSFFLIMIVSLFLSINFINLSFSLDNEELKFYAISDPDCPSCINAMKALIDMYEEKIIIYDIEENNNSLRFYSIIDLLELENYDVPLVGVFINESLSAVVLGSNTQEEWENIISTKYDGVPIYNEMRIAGKLFPDTVLKGQDIINSIANLLIEEEINSGEKIDFFNLIPIIIMAALVDAINPCEFYLLIVFLSLVFYQLGRKAVLKSGISYSIAIFIVYFSMGFGILSLLKYIQSFKVLFISSFSIFGLIVGIRNILGVILNKDLKLIPNTISERVSNNLRKVTENPLTSFGLGLISGIFLLPCTSGPYFIALSFIADLDKFLEGIILITIYNSIIIMPFIVISFTIYQLKLKTSELKKWSTQNKKWINLISGIVIIILSLYLMSSLLT